MVLFESREFTQDRADQDWTFGDVATGQTLLHCSPIVWPWLNDAPAHDAPRRLRAEIRPVDITYCMKGVSRLRELFETSVRLGRPVFWE